MIEEDVMTAISGLVDGRVYYDEAPENTQKPYITLQQVGGEPLEFLDQDSGSDFARLQIDVFASKRTDANQIMTQVRQLLVPFQAQAVGAPISDYEASIKTYRRSCDFRILAQY